MKLKCLAFAGVVSFGLTSTSLAQNQSSANQENSAQTQSAAEAQTEQSAGQVGGRQAGRLGSGNRWNGINQTPWFNDRGAQQQLGINEEQIRGLRDSYGQSFGQYRDSLNQLPNDLNQEQMQARRQELSRNFYRGFSENVDRQISDPVQRRRFNQLGSQYLGPYAFDNEAVQRQLNLTDEQQRRLREVQQDWSRQMDSMATNRGEGQGASAWSDYNRRTNQAISGILTPGQRERWNEYRGETYEFPSSAYSASEPNRTSIEANQQSSDD